MSALEVPAASGPAVSVVIPAYGRPDLLSPCLQSVERSLGMLGEVGEVIVIDDASGCPLTELQGTFPWAAIESNPRNLGFAATASLGMKRARGEWIVLLNADTILEESALTWLLRAGRRDSAIGSVATQMRFMYPPWMLNSAGIEVDRLGIASDRLLGLPLEESESEPIEVFGASAGAALYRSRMLEEVGLFDESFHAYLEDVDLAWRARMAGWRCVYEPRAVVHHHRSVFWGEGSARKDWLSGRNRVRLLAKHLDRGMLMRRALAIVVYDLVHVGAIALRRRSLAALRGRLRGVREWKCYRAAGHGRLPVSLSEGPGLVGTWRRYRNLKSGGTSSARRAGAVDRRAST